MDEKTNTRPLVNELFVLKKTGEVCTVLKADGGEVIVRDEMRAWWSVPIEEFRAGFIRYSPDRSEHRVGALLVEVDRLRHENAELREGKAK